MSTVQLHKSETDTVLTKDHNLWSVGLIAPYPRVNKNHQRGVLWLTRLPGP